MIETEIKLRQLKPGDRVWSEFGESKVVRLNKKTMTVKAGVLTKTVPYDRLALMPKIIEGGGFCE